MALLQISEPGQSPEPHRHRLAVGIDLGTTNSLVAAVRNGIAVVLNDHEGRALLPSIVRYLGDGGVAVGVEAEAALARDPKNTVVSVKRFMGRGLKDVTHVENSPYDFLDSPGMVRIRTAAGVKSPVEVSADILKVLRARAEESLGGERTGAIITVPAYCDDAQRQATTDAARLAGGETVDVTVTQKEFQEMTRPLVAKTLAPCRRALRDAGLDRSKVKGVVMVGGATRMPHAQQAVAELFGQSPLNNLDPDKVVALGAAIQANVLAGNRASGDDWLLLDVIPLSLGVQTMGGLAERVIPRNSTIPAARAQEFTTYKDGQTAMSIHVVQGERELVSDCRSLARFELRGIPPMVAGAARIRVTFQVDADGLLSVSACEATTGVEAAIAVKPSYGLTDEQVTQMLRDSFDHAKDDVHVRALREQRVEGERMLEATEAALREDADLLSKEESAALRAELDALRKTLACTDHRTIKSGIERVNRASEAFAGRRMDRSIKRALAGRKVESL